MKTKLAVYWSGIVLLGVFPPALPWFLIGAFMGGIGGAMFLVHIEEKEGYKP